MSWDGAVVSSQCFGERLAKGVATLPLPLEYPVKNMDGWLKIKHGYAFSEARFGQDWERVLACVWKTRGKRWLTNTPNMGYTGYAAQFTVAVDRRENENGIDRPKRRFLDTMSVLCHGVFFLSPPGDRPIFQRRVCDGLRDDRQDPQSQAVRTGT